jgi:hypothetical protein
MSLLLAAVQTVAATPLPSPEVVTKTVEVAVTPDWVKETASLMLLLVPGYAASWLHSLVNEKKDGTNRFKPWFNAGLLFLYSAGLAVLGIIVQGGLHLNQVDWSNPELVVGSFLTVMGAAAARYAYLKARYSNPAPATTAQTAAGTTLVMPASQSSSTTEF